MSCRRNRIARGSTRGSVLILTLWTLFFLTALSLATGALVQASIGMARGTIQRTHALTLARSGADWAAAQLLMNTNRWVGLAPEHWNNDSALFSVRADDKGGMFDVTYAYKLLGGRTATNVGVICEERFINIREANEALLRGMFEAVAGVDRIRADELAAAVIEWRKPKDAGLTAGLLPDYYQSLGETSESSNGPFRSIYELQLVDGIEADVFDTLLPYLTVYGKGKIDINTAGGPVLRSLALAVGDRDGAIEGLLLKLQAFRDAGLVFQQPERSRMVAALQAAVNPTQEEINLFRRMLGYCDIHAVFFRGRVTGRPDGIEPAEGLAAVDFVFDRDRKVMAFWRER